MVLNKADPNYLAKVRKKKKKQQQLGDLGRMVLELCAVLFL